MARQQDLKISPAGIWSAPSAIEAPEGALSVADNIVLRRTGLAQPRPGFGVSRDLGSEPDKYGLIGFGSGYLRINPDTPLTEWSGGTDLEDEATDPLTWQLDALYGAEARKNLYLVTSDVLRKTTAVDSVLASQTGAPVPSVHAVIGGNGNAVAISSYVRYRALTKRTDANLYTIRSGVSGGFVLFNSSTTAAKAATVTVVLNPEDDFKVGDVLEIYRSFSELVIPPDEEYLAKSITIDASILSAGFVTFTDNLLDEDLGAALYTNVSREGIEANHIRPPRASYVELFNGSLFLSDLKFPAEQIIAWSAVVATSSATAVGTRVFTGDFTNGSADIVNVTPTTGLQVGQIIVNTASEWTVNTEYVRITAIVGSTVTMSTTYAGATAAGVVRAFVDSIRIGSLYFPADSQLSFVSSVRDYDVSINPGGHSPAVDVTANLIGDYRATEKNFVQIITVKPSITAPVIYATHGDQYEPVLPLPTATGLTIPQEISPGGIMWSNNQQPEEFTLPNMEIVGTESGRIMALRAMKNALLIFKDEGLYRCSGAGSESGFRFEQHSPNVRLLFSAATAPVGEKVYAWCDLGVYECDENDVLDISNPALRDQLEPTQRVIRAGSRTAYGAWATSNRKSREFILSVPDTNDITAGGTLFVFNQETGTWVTWNFEDSPYHAGLDRPLTGSVIIVGGQMVLEERDPFVDSSAYHSDRRFSITITVASGPAITIAGGSGWTPVVGDMVVQSSTFYRVTAVTDATHFTVHQTGLSAAAAFAHVAFTSTMEFIAAVAKHPGLLKSWGEGACWWDDLTRVEFYTLGFTSSLPASPESQVQLANGLTDGRAESYRFVVPRNHSLCTRLYPVITIRQAGSPWAFSALGLGYRYMSDRVRSR